MTKILICQSAAHFGDKAANVETIRRTVAAATELGVDVAVFPELFLSGYNIGDLAASLAEPVDGAMIGQLRNIARETGTALVTGFIEQDGASLKNATVAIDGAGQIAGLHRKVRLFGPWENAVFTAGEEFRSFPFLGTTCGLAICYDIEFVETGRALARQETKLVLNPTANMDPFVDVPTTLVRARALENGLAIAYANLCGTEGDLTYSGASCIVGPDGRDRARAGRGPAVLVADCGIDAPDVDQGLISTQLRDLDRYQPTGNQTS